jgi:hypothetical protein
MTFWTVVIAVVLLWVLRPFVVGPFERCFFVTGLLSVFVVVRSNGAKRVIGAVILIASILGLTHDVLARVGERRAIQEKHEQIMHPTNEVQQKGAAQ